MTEPFPESLFFANLPDIHKLCTVKITLKPGLVNTAIRDVQIKLCRHLLFVYNDIIATPEPEHLDQIFVIMAISFYKTGKVQAIAEKHEAYIDAPEKVTLDKLQACLSYTFVARLSPCWNKAGHLLIQGEDFLSSSVRQSAVGMQITVSDLQLCVSVQAYTVRLPPCELSDFNIATGILQGFKDNRNFIIPKNFISNNWCYILPSMKRGQIVSISHDIPRDSPFKSYKDLQIHWNMLYGYKLPDIPDEHMTYCSVYFKLIGEKLFTSKEYLSFLSSRYPFSCLRSQPVQYFPQVNVAGVLTAFLSDFKERASCICGFPLFWNNKPFYPIPILTRPSSQVGREGAKKVREHHGLPKSTEDNEMKLVNVTTHLISRGQTHAKVLTDHKACNAEIDQTMESVTLHSKANALGRLHAMLQSPPAPSFIKQATSSPFQLRSQHSSLTQTVNLKRIEPAFKSDVKQVNRRNTNIANTQKRDALEHRNPADSKQYSQNPLTPRTLQLSEPYNISHVDITEKRKEEVTIISNSKSFRPLFNCKLPSKEKASICGNSPACLQNRKGDIHPMLSHSSCPPSLASRPIFATKLNTYGDSSVPSASNEQVYHSEKNVCTKYKRKPKQHGESPLQKVCMSVSDRETFLAQAIYSTQRESTAAKPKRSKNTKPVIEDVDIESHARDNKLFKVKNSILENWLNQRGIFTKARARKEELITKIMQSISEI